MNFGLWPKECDFKSKSSKWGFYEESKELHYLTRCLAQKLEKQNALGKTSQTKQMGKDQLDDLESDWPTALKILDGIVWDFHPSEMMDVMEDHEVWRLNLELMPPQLSQKSEQ